MIYLLYWISVGLIYFIFLFCYVLFKMTILVVYTVSLVFKLVIKIFEEKKKTKDIARKNETHNKIVQKTDENKKILNSTKKVNTDSNKMNAYQLELFMIECNAYTQHEQDMEEYKRYYNIKD